MTKGHSCTVRDVTKRCKQLAYEPCDLSAATLSRRLIASAKRRSWSGAAKSDVTRSVRNASTLRVVHRIPAHCMLATGDKMINAAALHRKRRCEHEHIIQPPPLSAICAASPGKRNWRSASRKAQPATALCRLSVGRSGAEPNANANLLLRFGLCCVVQAQDCVVDLRRRFRAMLVACGEHRWEKVRMSVALRTEAKPARYFRAQRQQTSASYSQRASW